MRSDQSVLGSNWRIEPVGVAMDWMWYVKEGRGKTSQMTTTIKIEKVGGGAGCWLYVSGGQRRSCWHMDGM